MLRARRALTVGGTSSTRSFEIARYFWSHELHVAWSKNIRLFPSNSALNCAKCHLGLVCKIASYLAVRSLNRSPKLLYSACGTLSHPLRTQGRNRGNGLSSRWWSSKFTLQPTSGFSPDPPWSGLFLNFGLMKYHLMSYFSHPNKWHWIEGSGKPNVLVTDNEKVTK